VIDETVTLGDPGRVLVCEDDPAARELLQVALSEAGLRVEVAEEGQSGLARAQQTAPDAIVADWLMPGLDGISLCSAAREHPALAHAHIVLVTGRTEPEYAQIATDAGADAVVTKPFDPAALAQRVVIGVRRSRLRRRAFGSSRTDYATGLRDERCLREDLDRLLALSTALPQPFPVAVAAVTGPPHSSLAPLADVLSEVLGPTDVLYRIGDREMFVIVAPDADDPSLLEAALREAARTAGLSAAAVRCASIAVNGPRSGNVVEMLAARLRDRAA
jgi:CheY-like chemotaxis protein